MFSITTIFDAKMGRKSDILTWMAQPPEKYGLIAGSKWSITDSIPGHMIVLAANDEWFIKKLLDNDKAQWVLIPQYMEVFEDDVIDFNLYKRVVVVSNLTTREHYSNSILVQTGKISDDDMTRWNY